MVQVFAEDRKPKCALFDQSSPDNGMAQCLPRRAQPKRPRVSTISTKEPLEQEYFVTISLSGDGPPQIKSSASLKPYKDHIVGDALTRFLDCISEAKADSTSPVSAQQILAPPTVTSTQPEAPCITYPFARRAKRRRSNSSVTPIASNPGDNVLDEDSDTASHCSEKLKELPIGNWDECRNYFLLGFQAIQQIDCRFLAKRWIKKIEPKKQVHHPYNGGKREPKNPEATKPKWWPIEMYHKEPDHINKGDRIKLLTHLILHTGTDLLKCAEPVKTADLLKTAEDGSPPMVRDLEEVTKPHVMELKNPKSWSILQEMFHVRRYMELVEFEGNDPEMYHKMVVDRSSETRRAQGEPRHVIDDDDLAECPEPPSSDGEEGGERCDVKAEPTANSPTFLSPMADTYLNKDHLMHGMDDQDHTSYDTTPPAQLLMNSNNSGREPFAYGGIGSHQSNLQSIPQYELSSIYAQGQSLEHQLYQRPDGSVPGIQQRAEFSAHTLQSSHPSAVYQWIATGPPDFCFPTQYQGMPSQAPAMQSAAGEQPIHDDGTYEVHQQDPNQSTQYNLPVFDHETPHPAFSEARGTSTPRWSHLAYRPASSNQIPISLLNDMSLPSGGGQLYQARLRELSEFE